MGKYLTTPTSPKLSLTQLSSSRYVCSWNSRSSGHAPTTLPTARTSWWLPTQFSTSRKHAQYQLLCACHSSRYLRSAEALARRTIQRSRWRLKTSRWTRATDADNKACKFGFAEYEDPESLSTAVEVLRDVEVPVKRQTPHGDDVKENGEVEKSKLLVRYFVCLDTSC